jgi:pimeloyl-ACP methyl ester carboxylesterase
MAEKELEIDSARIVYFVEGSGPPLILLPSGGGRGKEYQELVPLLAPSFTVYTLDYPGFGRSDELKWTDGVISLAEFVFRWADAAGIRDFYLTGFSMGGIVALHMAISGPERIKRLCVIATASGKIDHIPIISPVGLNMKEILAFFYHRPEVKEKIRNEKLSTSEKKEIHRSSETFAKMARASKIFTDVNEQLSLIRCPTLVIGAENDQVIPLAYPKEIVRRIRGAEWIAYPETGHFVIVERPRELAADLIRFFKSATLAA